MYRRCGFPLLRGTLLAEADPGWRRTPGLEGAAEPKIRKATNTLAHATEVIRSYGADRFPDVIATLSSLAELAELGVLTSDEYAAARCRLLEAYRLTP